MCEYQSPTATVQVPHGISHFRWIPYTDTFPRIGFGLPFLGVLSKVDMAPFRMGTDVALVRNGGKYVEPLGGTGRLNRDHPGLPCYYSHAMYDVLTAFMHVYPSP